MGLGGEGPPRPRRSFTRPDPVIPCRFARQQMRDSVSPGKPQHRALAWRKQAGTLEGISHPWSRVMQDHQLYQQILGIGAPWRVERVELDLEEEDGGVHVYL